MTAILQVFDSFSLEAPKCCSCGRVFRTEVLNGKMCSGGHVWYNCVCMTTGIIRKGYGMGVCKERLTEFQDLEAKNLELRFKILILVRKLRLQDEAHSVMRSLSVGADLVSRFNEAIKDLGTLECTIKTLELENERFEEDLKNLQDEEISILAEAQASSIEELTSFLAMKEG